MTEVGVNPSTLEKSDINREVHFPLESLSINVEPLSTVIIEDSNRSTPSPFKRALFWPEPKKKQLKRGTTQKVLAVATSSE